MSQILIIHSVKRDGGALLSLMNKKNITAKDFSKQFIGVGENEKNEGLKPIDLAWRSALIAFHNQGKPIDVILHTLSEDILDKQARYRLKKYLKGIYDRYILPDGLDNSTDSISQTLKKIGFFSDF